MATKLSTPVSRETANKYHGRPVIVTLAPAGSLSETLLGLRLKGKRTQYVLTLSDCYRMAAMWHGNAEKAARRQARKNGVPWATAKKQFIQQHSIP